MQKFGSSYETIQRHGQAAVNKQNRRARQKEVFIWINWVVTVGALVALSAVSLALDWPLAITCVLILLTGLYGFFLALMVLLLFDKDAFK